MLFVVICVKWIDVGYFLVDARLEPKNDQK